MPRALRYAAVAGRKAANRHINVMMYDNSYNNVGSRRISEEAVIDAARCKINTCGDGPDLAREMLRG